MKDSNILRIDSILKQLKTLNEQYEKYVLKKGEKFNVFSIIGRQHYEVQTHSAFIAELLNPKGSHGQGSVFLELFLNLEKIGSEYGGLSNYEDFKVYKEFHIKSDDSDNTGIIDILLRSRSNDKSIAVENKIYASDQPKQLYRYYKHTESPVIYLTLDGSEPGEYTLGDLTVDNVICLSYADDIAAWLNTCMKEVPLLPQIREILHQYQILVKTLTGQPIDWRYTMEIANIFFEGDNCKLIPTLENSILEFKVQLQLKFWEELENKMKEKKFELCKNIIYENFKDYERQQTESTIRTIYRSRRPNNRWYGKTFSNPHFEQQLTKRAVRIEIDNNDQGHDFILWGFVLLQFGDNEQNPSRIIIPEENKFIFGIRENVDDILKKNCTYDLQLGVQTNDWWCGYIYPIYNNCKYDFSFVGEESLKFIHMMVSEEKREKIISELTNEIEVAFDQFQRLDIEE